MKSYALLLFYVVASLLIGKEFHPFSRFPMYNLFPNWSYVFFLKNEKEEAVFYNKNFKDLNKKNAGNVAHSFYTLLNHQGDHFGYGKESHALMRNTGKQLMDIILEGEDQKHFKFDTLKLYRRFYHLENNQLVYRDDLMYAQTVRP